MSLKCAVHSTVAPISYQLHFILCTRKQGQNAGSSNKWEQRKRQRQVRNDRVPQKKSSWRKDSEKPGRYQANSRHSVCSLLHVALPEDMQHAAVSAQPTSEAIYIRCSGSGPCVHVRSEGEWSLTNSSVRLIAYVVNTGRNNVNEAKTFICYNLFWALNK
jgi:4-diphosphocytidyl-2C-methyl-D-erythritol kinase